MDAITITVRFGTQDHTLRIDEDKWAYGPVTLVFEKLNPFLPPGASEEGYDIRILSTETRNGEVIDGIRVSKLVEDGRLLIRILDPDGQPIQVEHALLDRIILVPTNDVTTAPSPAQSARTLGKEVDDRDKGTVGSRLDLEPDVEPPFSSIQVRIYESALLKAQHHASSHNDREVGGICVGTFEKDKPSGRWIMTIIDTFRAKHTVNRGASITFTADTWSDANRRIAQEYETNQQCMVGWYHTHPGFGIFLSAGYDLFIHENFFVQPWQVALVIDPVNKQYGVFAWDGSPKKIRRYPNRQIELVRSTDRLQIGNSTPELATLTSETTPRISADEPAATVTQQSNGTTGITEQERGALQSSLETVLQITTGSLETSLAIQPNPSEHPDQES